MRIEDLIDSLPKGLWKDNLALLKAQTDGKPMPRAERKWLEHEILQAQKAWKRGRLVNLLTLALALDRIFWSEWIRKSPVLRATKYDLNCEIPKFLCSRLLECSEGLSLDKHFTDYLATTDNLLNVTPAFRELQTSIVKSLFREKNRVLKSALAVVELAFLTRQELGFLTMGGLIAESIADGFSFLTYLYASRVGYVRGGFEGVDPRCVSTDLYLNLVVDAHVLSNYGQWEFLVGHFGYSCIFDKQSKTLQIRAPSREFAKSLRLGYVSTFTQRLALAQTMESQNVMSLEDASKRLSATLDKQGLFVLKEKPVRRWTFGLPEVDALKKLVRDDKLFREEFENLTRLSIELLSNQQEIESFSIRAVKMHSLLRAQRFARLLRGIMSKFLATKLKEEPETVAQSLIPVFDRASLLKFIAYGAGEDAAETILDSLTWRSDQNKVFDVMYQPIIAIDEGQYMVPFNILAEADIVRNSMQLFQKRLRDGTNDLLSERLRMVLSGASWDVKNDVTYKYGGLQGDIDVVAIKEGALFIFECKNSLHPCSMAELRTSLDYILHSQEQLDRFKILWNRPGFREYLSKRLGWVLDEISSVTTCVVTGNRMFSGMRLGGHAIRSFLEIGNFIHTGTIVVFGKTIELRQPGKLTSSDLRAFVDEGILHDKLLTSMVSKDEIVELGTIRVVREEYVQDQEILGREFGIEPIG